MKYIKKSLALLLALSMLLAMAPAGLTASAEEVTPELTPNETVAPEETTADEVPAEETPGEESTTVKVEQDTMDTAIPGNPQIPTITDQSESGFHVNPLYEGILSADDFPTPDFSHMKGDTSAVQSDYVSPSDAVAQIRQNMLARNEYYTLYICTTSSDRWDVFETALAEALAHNGNPKEGDCLMWVYGGWGGDSASYHSGSTYYYTLYIYMTYYTTAEQEAQLDTAVSNLLAQLNLWDKTDYEKVCGVYDYICDNIVYDYVHLNDPSYLLMFTAYAALVNKTAVCQGYAVLFYRLMLELGVDARVIVGDGGGPHAWNIVELDNLYYNLDSTWDAGRTSYDYFLQSPADFAGHTREPEYETAEFHAAYPMSPSSYGETFDPDIYTLTLDTWQSVYIGTSGDSAYYQFTPTVSGYYTLYSSSSYDTRCDLYNSSWGLINYDDDSGDNYNFLLESWLDAGITYYYKVYFYGSSTGSFQILLEMTDGSSEGSDEPTITPLVLNQMTDVCISTKDERVLYSFTPTVSGFYTICAYSESDTYCFVFDSNWNYLSAADDSGPGANFFKTEYIDVGETYYYEVCFYSETETGSFQICMTQAGATDSGKIDNYVGNYYTVSDLTLGADGVYRTPEGGTVYIAVDNYEEGGLFWLNNYTLYDFVIDYGSSYFDLTYWDNLVNLMDDDGYVELTENTLYYLVRLITGNANWEETEDYAPYYFFYDVSGGEEEEITIHPLSLDVYTDVHISSYGECAYYSYTPAESGYYTLTAYAGGLDTWCEVNEVGDDGWSLLGGDEGGDFCYTAYLEAGCTYYFLVGCANTGSFQILLTRMEEETTIHSLSLNVPTAVTISIGGQWAYYSFTPSESGNYTLTATSDSDTVCNMYDTEWNWVGNDDDSGEGLNFMLEVWLEAGVTYYFEVYYYSATATGSFEILLTRTITYGTGRIENNGNANYVVSDLILGNDGIYRTPDGCIVYIAIANYTDGGLGWLTNFLLPGNTLYDYVDTYGTAYFDLTYWNELLELMDEYGYVVLTPTSLQYFITTITGNPEWGETAEDVQYYLFYDPTPTEDTHTHSYTAVVTAPTCTEGGYTTYTCSCGDTYVGDYTGALGHSYVSVVTAPTCTTGGYTTHTCSACGDTYVDGYTGALGHSYVSLVTVPTCTTGGYTTHTCSTCGDAYVDGYTGALGHSYVSVVTAPTCTEGGYTTHTCSACGDSYTDSYTGALDHNHNYDMTLTPTLTSTGMLTGTCSRCDDTVTVQMPKLNPVDYTREILLPPTEETEGIAIYIWNNTSYGIFSVMDAVPKLSDVLLGDVNGDGNVDIFDANLVVAFYNGTAVLTDAQQTAADVNGSGDVDIFDANLIVSYYNGTIDSFPAEN